MKSDTELVQMVRSGDKTAFSELVKRHQKLLMRVALRVTRDLNLAEDVVQESFIKAFQRLELFEGRASFRSWVYQITLNTGKNRLRSLKRESVPLDNIHLSVDGVAEDRLVEVDVKTVIQDEVSRLPARQKTALELRIFDELSFKEIAEIMECPYDTAKANYRHALMKLKSRLESNTILKQWSRREHFILSEFNTNFVEVDG